MNKNIHKFPNIESNNHSVSNLLEHFYINSQRKGPPSSHYTNIHTHKVDYKTARKINMKLYRRALLAADCWRLLLLRLTVRLLAVHYVYKYISAYAEQYHSKRIVVYHVPKLWLQIALPIPVYLQS